jgi:hypothetical protein
MFGYENVYGKDRRTGRVLTNTGWYALVEGTTSLSTSILATGTSARSAVTP